MTGDSGSGPYDRFARWVLVEGNRLLITGGLVAGIGLLTWGLVSAGLLSVGPRSPIRSVLASGAVAGLFSLISVTLAITQLISSRVFGALDRLQDKLEGGNDLRAAVADVSDRASAPVHAAEFISFVGETIETQTDDLRNDYAHRPDEFDERLDAYVDELDSYSDVVQRVSDEMAAERVISTLAGPDFAHHLKRTDELRSEHRGELTADERETLDTIADLLGTLSVFRQYFKTIALHQELAQLSRQFIVVGFPAVVVALLVPLVYETSPPNVLVPYPAAIASGALAVVVTPLVLLMVYMLRIATIFRYTVSVAPFVPPVEWPWSEEPDRTDG